MRESELLDDGRRKRGVRPRVEASQALFIPAELETNTAARRQNLDSAKRLGQALYHLLDSGRALAPRLG